MFSVASVLLFTGGGGVDPHEEVEGPVRTPLAKSGLA